MRSATRASGALWVTMMTVLPSRLMSRIAPRTSLPVRKSRLPVGSSPRITAGSFASARATATRCCSPPESCEGKCLSRSPRPTEREQRRGVGCGRVAVPRGELDREPDVLLGGQRGDQVEELEDEADLLAAEVGELVLREVRDVDAVDDDASVGGRVDAAEEVEERGLARAARSDDRHELAARDAEIDVVEGGDVDLAHLVVLADVLEHDDVVGRAGRRRCSAMGAAGDGIELRRFGLRLGCRIRGLHDAHPLTGAAPRHAPRVYPHATPAAYRLRIRGAESHAARRG